MKSIYVSDLDKGQTITGETFAVQDVKLAETKGGKPYYRVILIDKTGSIPGQIWADNIPNVDKKALKAGKVVMIEANVDDYKGALQLNILSVAGVDETRLDEYMDASEMDLDYLWTELEKHVASISQESLQKFIQEIISRPEIKHKFKTGPAAEFVHHAFQGGLLEHVIEMLKLMDAMKEFYPNVNYDYVTAGIILHDIGKLEELEVKGTVVQRTTEGYLIGHIIKSYELLITEGEKCLDYDTMIALKHIILSHHGIKEYGSPVVPATIEAMMVHMVDETSTKVRIFQKIMKKNESRKQNFSEYDPILGTKVYLNQGEEID